MLKSTMELKEGVSSFKIAKTFGLSFLYGVFAVLSAVTCSRMFFGAIKTGAVLLVILFFSAIVSSIMNYFLWSKYQSWNTLTVFTMASATAIVFGVTFFPVVTLLSFYNHLFVSTLLITSGFMFSGIIGGIIYNGDIRDIGGFIRLLALILFIFSIIQTILYFTGVLPKILNALGIFRACLAVIVNILLASYNMLILRNASGNRNIEHPVALQFMFVFFRIFQEILILQIRNESNKKR